MKFIKELFIGIDCGQTAVKISAFDIFGREMFSVSFPTGAVTDGCLSTLDTSDLWNKLCLNLKKVVSFCGDRIASVGVSGHGNGAYFLCGTDPFARAILSTDCRASEIVDEWNRDGTSEKIKDITLCLPWAGGPAPILSYLKRHDPFFLSRITAVLSCADWVNYMLTGTLSADTGGAAASGLINQFSKGRDAELYGLYGLPELIDLVPEMLTYGDPAGCVSTAASDVTGLRAGTPVGCGCFDVNACCIGSGMPDTERYAVTAGTWSINTGFTDFPVLSKRLFSCNLFGDGTHYASVESSPTSAVNLEHYLKGKNALAPADCDRIVEQTTSVPQKNALYMPYINRMPAMPWLKGGFTKEAETLDERQKIRLLFEGVAMGHRFHIERLKSAGIIRSAVRLSGGVSKSDVWVRIFADVLGMPVETCGTQSCGALGAAFSGAVACGTLDGIREATDKCSAVKKIFYPDPGAVEFYNEKYSEFTDNISEQTRLYWEGEIIK